MRESRTAPSVTQKLEGKVSGAGKKVVLTSLQSFPRGMECIDPLKLGYFPLICVAHLERQSYTLFSLRTRLVGCI